MDETKYVVFRTGWADRELSWLTEDEWEQHMRKELKSRCVEISRGHTLVDAINLTMLANQQKEMERNEI